MSGPVQATQRFTRHRPCPVCGGHEKLPRGQQIRCHGYLRDDERFPHCSREEYAGGLPLEDDGTYRHYLDGPCNCGADHRDAGRRHPRSERRATLAPSPSTVAAPSKRVVAAYPTATRTAPELFQVLRYDPKGFSQRRPDGNGGYHWNLTGTRRVLYRLPELLASDPASTVYVVEGEKAVDRLRDLGLVATCSPGGAGKWRQEYVSALQDRDVVVLPDSDDLGRGHADAVRQSLAGVARSVRVLDLPELPPKGDVVDWLDNGGMAESLGCLAEGARAPEHHERSSTTEDDVTDVLGPRALVRSFADIEATEVEWLWPGWLARGEFHLLGGYMGDGKSTLTAWLAATLSVGGEWPDGTRAPVTNTLLLLAEDNLKTTVKPRLVLHGADTARIQTIELVRDERGNDRAFNLRDHVEVLRQTIIEYQIGLVIVDPLSSFMPRADRNSEGDVRDILTPLRSLQEQTGVAELGIMHFGKPTGTARKPIQMLLGSTGFPAVARLVWMIAELPDDEGAAEASNNGAVRDKVVEVMKSNLALKPPPLRWSRPLDGAICWHGISPVGVEEALSAGKPERPIEAAKAFLWNELKGGCKLVAELYRKAGQQGITEATLRRAKEALDIRAIKEPGKTNGGWLWTLPPGTPLSAAGRRCSPVPRHIVERLHDFQTDSHEGAHRSPVSGSEGTARHPLPRRRSPSHAEHLPEVLGRCSNHAL